MEVSLKTYDFILEEAKQFKDKKGIYALVYDNEVIYVGQSKNLYDRLKAHMNKNALQNTIKKVISEDGKCNRCKAIAMYNFIDNHREDMQFIILKETEELEKTEQHYITLFKPKYNYKGVDVPF